MAKDAADVVLLDKDLGVLAEGVMEGRRIFNNTMKYVLMATSSNFGNMFSAAGASVFLTFLPMLPSQILLNNLLYNTGQLVIPTDRVDPEALARPAAWDMKFIRRFMSVFGPVSSIFDFLTFWVMLAVLHAGHVEFRTGWFVESIATQTLVIYVIRTRRVPFFKSRPSWPMLVVPTGAALVGAVLPYTGLAHLLGFTPLPTTFFLLLFGMVVVYLLLVELAKTRFYRTPHARTPPNDLHPYGATGSADQAPGLAVRAFCRSIWKWSNERGEPSHSATASVASRRKWGPSAEEPGPTSLSRPGRGTLISAPPGDRRRWPGRRGGSSTRSRCRTSRAP